MIADVTRGGQQILLVTFDIANSNWPWHLSFPLFLQNLVSWVPRASMASDMSVRTGRPFSLMPIPGVEAASVTKPNGDVEKVALDPVRPTQFGSTTRAGAYEVVRGELTEQYAVNLLNMNESDLPPAESLGLGRGEVEAVRGKIKQNRELWRWLTLAALAILACEWWVYGRRAWL